VAKVIACFSVGKTLRVVAAFFAMLASFGYVFLGLYHGNVREIMADRPFGILFPVATLCAILLTSIELSVLVNLVFRGGMAVYVYDGNLVYINSLLLKVPLRDILSSESTELRRRFWTTRVIRVHRRNGSFKDLPAGILDASPESVVDAISRASDESRSAKAII
jgi:hypothetical protein